MNGLNRIQEALALIEVSSIARGIRVLDALHKRAMVRVLRSEAVTPGKFLILFVGWPGDVEEAFGAALKTADVLLVDSLHLPDAHPELLPLIEGKESQLEPDEALCIQEYASVSTGLFALDKALKAANVQARKLRLAKGIGGKAYFVLGGTLADVTAAHEATPDTQRIQAEIIPRLSPDVRLEHI